MMNYKNYFKKIENDPEYREAKEKFGLILDIGDEVLRLRIEKGWSQAELAERAGTKQANISRLESGLSNPSVRFLQKVAKALDAKISVGFEREVFFAVDYSTTSQEAIQIRNWPQPPNLPKITTTSNKSVTASFDLAQRK